MRKNKAIIGMTATFILLTLVFSTPVQAEEDAVLNISIVTDGNVTATFNATAGGNVTYWIDGVEVNGEFDNLWNALEEFGSVWNALNNLKDDVNNAKQSANVAFLYATSNYNMILEHNESINDLYDKIFILMDELIGFEGEYFAFKNETFVFMNSTKSNLSAINKTLDEYGEIIKNLQNNIAALQSDFNGTIALIRNIFISGGVIVFGLFLINRRHPLKEIISNNNKQRLSGLVHRIKKPGKIIKTKASRFKYIITHIRRNPEKSPIRYVFSFLHIHK